MQNLPTRLSQWLAYLETLPSGLAISDLGHIKQVANLLAINLSSYPIITVAGTNGKGSCVAILETIYLLAGYKTAAYTSPHLLKYNERIKINQQEIDDASLCLAFTAIENTRQNIQLSYFEFTTLAALYLFQKHQPDVIILEAGLGGRLDAVNIVDPTVAVITTVSLDHTHILGTTREAIGKEKAGIMRPNHPVICGDTTPPSSIYQQAKITQANLYCLNQDFTFTATDHTWKWRYQTITHSSLPLPCLPIQDAATALMVIHLLQKKLQISIDTIKQGLQQARLPGRFQTITMHNRNIILDVAHNPESITLLAKKLLYLEGEENTSDVCYSQSSFKIMSHIDSSSRALQQDIPHNLSDMETKHCEQECPEITNQNVKNPPNKTIAIISMLKDKDITSSLQPITPYIDQWFVTTLDNPRAASKQQLLDGLRHNNVPLTNIEFYPNVLETLKQAIASVEKNARIVVFGSFYIIAAVLKNLSNI